MSDSAGCICRAAGLRKEVEAIKKANLVAVHTANLRADNKIAKTARPSTMPGSRQRHAWQSAVSETLICGRATNRTSATFSPCRGWHCALAKI